MKKILALMMILMMLSALTLTSGAANTKQEEPPVNFDAVVKEFYKEGEEVTVPGKAPVGESIVYVEPSAVEDMMNVDLHAIADIAGKASAYQITGQQITFEGVCPECAKKESH